MIAINCKQKGHKGKTDLYLCRNCENETGWESNPEALKTHCERCGILTLAATNRTRFDK